MECQPGIVIAGVNDPYTIVDNIPRPLPGPNQVLVKSLAVGINPIEPLMHHSGILITSFPAVLGCDASGVILETGAEVTRLKKGDHVYGCTRLGIPGYSTFQETFLMDENIAMKQTGKVTVENAATIGVGLYTAGLCILSGFNLSLPEPGSPVKDQGEWIIVYGASGSVGQYGIQIGRLCGYKVLASCSPSKVDVCLANGAASTFNHRLGPNDQLAEIKKITDGKFRYIFDASGQSHDVAIKALLAVSQLDQKKVSSVDDWSQWNDDPSIEVYRAELGLIGRQDNPIGAQTTQEISAWIPSFEAYMETGALSPLECQMFQQTGWQGVIDAIAVLEANPGSRKIVVKL